MLANFRCNISIIIFRQRFKPLQRILRFDHLAICGIIKAANFAPSINFRPPGFQGFGICFAPARLPNFEHILQNMRHIPKDRDIDMDHLVDRGGININMRFCRPGAKGIKPASDPVIKSCANIDHQITIMHHHIRFIQTVHAQHAQPIGTVTRITAEPHKG